MPKDLPEIDSIRVYQSVSFEKKQETFFSTRQLNVTPGRTILLNEKYSAVEIKSETDHIMIPMTNVSAIYFKSDLKKKQIEEAENAKAKKVGVRASEIKRPR
jgi:hypothetical protein